MANLDEQNTTEAKSYTQQSDATQNVAAQKDAANSNVQENHKRGLFEKIRISRNRGWDDDPREGKVTSGEKIKRFAYKKTPDRFKNASDLQVRLRTGAIYIALTLLGIIIGGWGLVVMLSITAGVCAYEFYFVLRADSKLPNEMLGTIAAILYPPAAYLFGLAGLMMLSMLLLLALLVWYVFWLRSRIIDVAVSFFGAAYTGLFISSFVLIEHELAWPFGSICVFLIFASVWLNDGMAYLVGSKIGKHKLAPRISPKKSWEGFIAGIITSMLVWCLMVLVPDVNIDIPMALFFGLVCGLMSVLGDLAESRIKRNSGVKDSGTLMPGHGGLLDRTDSMFLAAVTSLILLVAGGCIPSIF